jgi:hypothetical protein
VRVEYHCSDSRSIADIDDPQFTVYIGDGCEMIVSGDPHDALHLGPGAENFSVRWISNFKFIVDILNQKTEFSWDDCALRSL